MSDPLTTTWIFLRIMGLCHDQFLYSIPTPRLVARVTQEAGKVVILVCVILLVLRGAFATQAQVKTASIAESTLSSQSSEELSLEIQLQITGEWSGQFHIPEQIANCNTILLFEREVFAIDTHGPEFTDLNLHFTKLGEALERRVPPNFAGFILLDFRTFPLPLKHPRNEIMAITRLRDYKRKHVDATPEEVDAAVSEAWRKSVELLLIRTIERIRQHSPHSTIGFRGFIAYSDSMNESHDTLRMNLASHKLWSHLDVLVPVLKWEANSTSESDYAQEVSDQETRIHDAIDLAFALEQEHKTLIHVHPLITCAKTTPPTFPGAAMHLNWLSERRLLQLLYYLDEVGMDGVLFSQFLASNHPKLPNEIQFIEQFLKRRFESAVSHFLAHESWDEESQAGTHSLATNTTNGDANGTGIESIAKRNPNLPNLTPEQLRRIRVRSSHDGVRKSGEGLPENRIIRINSGRQSAGKSQARSKRKQKRPSRSTSRRKNTRSVSNGVVVRRSDTSGSTDSVTVTKSTAENTKIDKKTKDEQ